MVTKVVDRLIDGAKDNEVDRALIKKDTQIIFATDKKIFHMQSGLGVSECSDYFVDGSGYYHADASFSSTEKLGISAKKRALLALDAACANVTTVGYPICIINTVTKEEIYIENREELDKYE